MRRTAGMTATAVIAVVLSGCSSGSADPPAASAPSSSPPSSSLPAPSGSGAAPAAPSITAGQPVATGLDVPWGVTFLADGSALVAERPTGRVVKVPRAGGAAIPVGTVPGVADQGEGGLLGLAFRSGANSTTSGMLYAYFTSTSGDNRIVRMPFDGTTLGAPATILKGIASAGNHNGGLLRIGPDDKLWAGTGDAADSARSQDRASLNGKILRLDLDGSVPAGNPFPGSPVYSLGHRNVQGLAFDSKGQPWAVEFGQNHWDELNRILPGRNYGWPTVEGKAGRSGFEDPAVQWATSEASPSGMAIVDDVAYVGALKGERLWQVPLNAGAGTAGTPKAWFEGRFGRIRTVAAAPGDRTLWITTSNRDGRGDPAAGDDRVIPVSLG